MKQLLIIGMGLYLGPNFGTIVYLLLVALVGVSMSILYYATNPKK